jgi:hypothetical protein
MPPRIIDRDRWERLPQWAQEELARLERDVEIAEAKLALGPESNTWYDPYNVPRPMGINPRVLHHAGQRSTQPDRGDAKSMTVEFNNGELTITAHGGYPAALGVVSNQIKVKVVDEW